MAETPRTRVEAVAEAEKRRLEAMGEASAVYARLEAEARGQYEILAKKAEGLKKIVDACGGSEDAYRMLMLEHLDTLAVTAASAISNIKFDKVVVWDGGSGTAPSNFLQGMTRALPPMMQVIRDIGGVSLPDFMGTPVAEEPARPADTVAVPKVVGAADEVGA
jgi:flotillin